MLEAKRSRDGLAKTYRILIIKKREREREGGRERERERGGEREREREREGEREKRKINSRLVQGISQH